MFIIPGSYIIEDSDNWAAEYHDMATRNITEPPPYFTSGIRQSWSQACDGAFLNLIRSQVEDNVKVDSSDYTLCSIVRQSNPSDC